MHSANKVKLATQKRQAFVSLLIWEAFLVPPVWNTGTSQSVHEATVMKSLLCHHARWGSHSLSMWTHCSQAITHISTWKETKPSFSKSHKKSTSFCFSPSLQVLCEYFFLFLFFVFFLYLSPFFSSYLRDYLNTMHHRPKEHYWLWYSSLWKISKQFRSLVATCMNLPWHWGAEQ